MSGSSRRRVLISEPCSWDMDRLGFPYLPYMWGVLKTYHEQHGRNPAGWEWVAPIYRYGRPEDLLRSRLDDPIDVLGLSCYTWNWKLQCAIAAAVKSRHPECLVVAGGPQPDFSNPSFFDERPYIDAVAVKDGEITFTRILDMWEQTGGELCRIRGLYLRTRDGLHFTGPAELPTGFEVSHYLAQADHYERIIRECGGKFCATWETNRGCPFACSFCDWGSNTMSKVRRFAPERVGAELEWLGRSGVSVVFLSDANFGMFREDVELGRRVADLFRKYGRPTTFSYNAAKNRPEPAIAISKALFDSGMAYKHYLSIQHTRDEVLAATDRKNISSEKQVEVVRELMNHGIPIEVQLILGIPGDTYPLWQGCFGDLMEWGIDGQYQTYLYHLLPNAPAASAEFRRRWRIGTVERGVYLSPQMGMIATDDAIAEKSDIIVSSASYHREDWVRMNVYAAIVKALHTSGVTQLIAHYLRRTWRVPYESFYRSLVDQWAAQTWWHARLTAHFREFLVNECATEFLAIDELPSYPHPVAPFQWAQIQVFLSLDAFFESLSRYLLAAYPDIENLASLLHYQKEILIAPDYDSRVGKLFTTGLDWPGYFRNSTRSLTAANPLPGSGGVVRASDTEGTDGVNAFPLDWFDREGEARWAAWIDRVILDYSCAGRGTFRKITLGGNAPSGEVTPLEAVGILRDYTSLVAAVDGTTVLDAAALAHPKQRILDALALLMQRSAEPSERASLSTAAQALAFFQPALGGTMLPLTSEGPGRQTWHNIVWTEMRTIKAALGIRDITVDPPSLNVISDQDCCC